ncbi:hypothetical protein [Caldimonas brevitalea]|uniref:DUF1330 domain-containing protein n=1 Tax=Caldimonas brevitalea TaxID=413882 RepID=A0A0G3BBH1_9BURK|nr:hypothetical protein [Caldimonas brevitalea]AKJ26714.1 hypothetical protein AAW51_0023 [Caldimonas brevitalea]
MPHLVQLLLPLYDNQGQRLASSLYAEVRAELLDRFGGLTAYTRAPATGVWEPDEGQTVRDDIVVYEVMVDRLDPPWWRSYREQLEARFKQDALVVRAHAVERL